MPCRPAGQRHAKAIGGAAGVGHLVHLDRPALDRVGKGALDRSISRQGKACGVIGVHTVGAHHARLRPAGRRRGFDHGIGAPRIQRAAIPAITVTEREHVIRRIRGRVRPGYRKVETNPVRIGTRISNFPHDDLLQGNPWRNRRRAAEAVGGGAGQSVGRIVARACCVIIPARARADRVHHAVGRRPVHALDPHLVDVRVHGSVGLLAYRRSSHWYRSLDRGRAPHRR